ncbi:type VI secretion system protein VasG [Paracoccus alcaliphilus]|uniref:Type VI secretion system protein VasG n=1 Tax=Paracoccus alcaliphilus TaxID=34002 RepID=A0A1H8EEN9_9RHOB|nr:type VI secretion system ATPase TssH [Paracoccus alcaliphilus]WCR20970.1 type VI secretion system ATPase TssH [Paracoccus alcaliphilus]SEN17943.1 type VI secretion system protein VasG [Paracoccus alcaliphilus]
MATRGSQQTIKRKELVGKLNPTCLKAFSEAAQAAKRRGNPYVELVHFITALADTQRTDVAILLEAAGVDRHRFDGDVLRATDALPHGAGSVEEFSDHIFRAIQEAWNYGSLEFGDDTVRSAYVLLGALQVPVLEGLLFKISLEFDKIDPAAMAGQLDDLLAGSLERTSTPDATGDKPARPRPGGKSALDQFATNLTARARDGKMDPVVGRDAEIRQIVDILLRRKQNNPILTGEAGVGKTAVVEGFAQRLAKGDVPPQLRNVELHMLDIGLMQAGASVKGEFEKRLKSVIEEVQSSDVPIILFIDEAHTLIGAGGAAGTGDAANLLKPALARGEMRTIAATTWAEYKQHIEPDPALTRRFQTVKIEEPDEIRAVLMCRGIAGVLEKHHQVELLDESIEAAVKLSHRYIPSRQLPDKAISLLDTACARVAVSQHATPAEVEDLERRLSALEIEQGIIEREEAIGIEVEERRTVVETAITAAKAALDAANERWDAEKAIVAEILDLRAQLRGIGAGLDGTGDLGDVEQAPTEDAEEQPRPETQSRADDAATEAPVFDRQQALATLKGKMADLTTAQGESPLILPSVDRVAVAAVVQDWTGIPTGRMLASQTEKALTLARSLAGRVVGQDHAMEMIANRIQTSAAGLKAPEKPVGVFLLCGPSGVGKTETALALAELMYGGEDNLISINMSEFQEAHTVSTLKGAPPGYVGYGKGGILTEAVRRRPYSVILLDEVEKAHPDVHEIFFQVFDKGMMDDSEGRRIDFKNTLILLTSNVGSEDIMAMTADGTAKTDPEELSSALRTPLLRVFPAALLGRVVTIPYYPLSDPMIEAIAGHKLRGIAKRLGEGYGAQLVIGDGAMQVIKDRCTEIESGGRMIDAILTNTLMPELSRRILTWRLEGRDLTRVEVSGGKAGFDYHFE